MTAHPACCLTHNCDLCPTCLSGTCCLVVPVSAAAPAAQPPTGLDHLRQGIAADLADQSSLSDLIQAEASRLSVHRLLAGTPVSEPAPVTLVHPPSRRPEQAAPALHETEQPALPPGAQSPTDLLTQQQAINRKDNT